MIEQFELSNDKELQGLFPALDGTEKIIEVVIPFSGGKSFAYQAAAALLISDLQEKGVVAITSYNQRRTIFTDDVIAEINKSILEQKEQLQNAKY